MSTPANTCSARMVTAVSAARNPAVGVITSAPLPVSGRSGSGGRANSSAYASLPRKYSPLTKANTSPSATPRFCRNRTARSNCARSDITICARGPEQFAGDKRKMRGDIVWSVGIRDPGSELILNNSRVISRRLRRVPDRGPRTPALRIPALRIPDPGSRTPVRLQTPPQEYRSHREASTNRGQQDETALLQSLLAHRVGEGEGNG